MDGRRRYISIIRVYEHIFKMLAISDMKRALATDPYLAFGLTNCSIIYFGLAEKAHRARWVWLLLVMQFDGIIRRGVWMQWQRHDVCPATSSGVIKNQRSGFKEVCAWCDVFCVLQLHNEIVQGEVVCGELHACAEIASIWFPNNVEIMSKLK